MTDVEQWDPAKNSLRDLHRVILSKGAQQLEQGDLCLSDTDQAELRSILLLGASSWEKFVDSIDSTTIIAWVKVLTISEQEYSGFECGAKSPVIPLVRVLKRRNEFPSDLTSWIKSHSRNRFLPHGSLLDRL